MAAPLRSMAGFVASSASYSATRSAPALARGFAMCLLLSEVGAVLFVFVAEQFENIGIRLQQLGERDGERPGVHLGIFNGDAHVQVAEIATAEALHDMQRVAVRVSRGIQPALVVEPDGIHHERIAFPFAYRVPE